MVYADDTLVIDVSDTGAQALMERIALQGQRYGLQLNWTKLEALPVRGGASIHGGDGKIVRNKLGLIYLGSLISADGRISSELGRRIGQAQQDISTLMRVWNHGNISRQRKLEVFDACVISKLIYCLFTGVLYKADLRRLDGLQARCLRQILKVPHSYYSRISNATVLQMAGAKPLSTRVLQQQMLYMGKVAQRSPEDAVRQCLFEEDGYNLKVPSGQRGRGRPRQQWAKTVYDRCLQMAGSHSDLVRYFNGTFAEWRRAVELHLFA